MSQTHTWCATCATDVRIFDCYWSEVYGSEGPILYCDDCDQPVTPPKRRTQVTLRLAAAPWDREGLDYEPEVLR